VFVSLDIKGKGKSHENLLWVAVTDTSPIISIERIRIHPAIPSTMKIETSIQIPEGYSVLKLFMKNQKN
jgi:hypothetical protein